MNIAVYSGSFNPLHIGHLAILKHLVGKGGFDRVYLIVSPKNPLKEGISSESGQERFAAAVEAVHRHFNKEPKIIVNDIELNMPPPHYTIRTLDALSEAEPDNSFTLVIGSDNLADIRRWRDYSRILKEYGVAVYPRSGFCMPDIIRNLHDEDPSYIINVINAEMVDISSTIIREALAEGRDVSEWLM